MMQASVERGGQDSIEEDKERDEHLGSTRLVAYAIDSSLPDFTMRINQSIATNDLPNIGLVGRNEATHQSLQTNYLLTNEEEKDVRPEGVNPGVNSQQHRLVTQSD